jgi:hypothetical protein
MHGWVGSLVFLVLSLGEFFQFVSMEALIWRGSEVN